MAKHKIKAQLYANLLTENPNDFIARVVSEKPLNIKNIAESAIERGGANVSVSAMEHNVSLWLKEMAYLLCDGFSINTGWFTVAPKIKGTFNSIAEGFDENKHAINFDMRQGQLLKKELKNAEIEITGYADVGAVITQVKDVKSESINDIITPNHSLRISGSKIKIAGENENNGVFFINDQTGERIKVEPSEIATNNPSELLVIVPNLAEGMYKLEIVTQYINGGNHLLREPRNVIYERVLTIA